MQGREVFLFYDGLQGIVYHFILIALPKKRFISCCSKSCQKEEEVALRSFPLCDTGYDTHPPQPLGDVAPLHAAPLTVSNTPRASEPL
jgi:hypothetical protein